MKTILLLFLCGVCNAAGYQTFLGYKGSIDPFILENTVRNLDRRTLELEKNTLTKSSATATYVKKTDISSVKMVIISTTTGANEGDITSVLHGLDSTKIIGLISAVSTDGINAVPSSFIAGNESLYYIHVYSANYINIDLAATDSGSVKGKPIKITVFYTE